MNQKKLSPAVIAVIVIVLVGMVAATAIIINQGNNQAGTTTQSSSDPAVFADGQYQAEGRYLSPGGPHTVNLTVTIENGVITETQVTTDVTDSESLGYVQRFLGGYETEVVGKPVNEVSLSRVAGSSLTSIGFNDALDKIKEDARS